MYYIFSNRIHAEPGGNKGTAVDPETRQMNKLNILKLEKVQKLTKRRIFTAEFNRVTSQL